jgi:hypothetical protein
MSQSKEPKFSESKQCGHCGNHSTMKVVAEFNNVLTQDYDNIPIDEGECYEVFQCPKCKGIELRSFSYCDACDPPFFDYKTLYPLSPEIPQGLPKKIQKEYEAALKEKRSSPNAYGVLMGRVLELVCEDKKATGRMLGNKLNNLADRNEFPSALAAVAFRLNDLRVLGAHASVGKLTIREVPIVENLTRAVLEYVYSGPYFVRQAERSVQRLQKRK